LNLNYQGSDYEEYYLQGRDAMQFGSSWPTFSGNAVSTFMVEELSQASIRQETLLNPEDGGIIFLTTQHHIPEDRILRNSLNLSKAYSTMIMNVI
jgi:hypothetical protein